MRKLPQSEPISRFLKVHGRRDHGGFAIRTTCTASAGAKVVDTPTFEVDWSVRAEQLGAQLARQRAHDLEREVGRLADGTGTLSPKPPPA